MRTKHPEKKYTAIRNYQPLKRIHRALKKSFMESVNQGRETDKDQGLVLAGPDRRDWLQVCIQKGHFKMGGKRVKLNWRFIKKPGIVLSSLPKTEIHDHTVFCKLEL